MKKEELIEKINEKFWDELREIVEYTTENNKDYLIVIRDPIEDHNPEESGDYEDEDEIEELMEKYNNDEVVDFTVYDVSTGEPVSASGGYFDKEYAIEIAQGDAESYSIDD